MEQPKLAILTSTKRRNNQHSNQTAPTNTNSETIPTNTIEKDLPNLRILPSDKRVNFSASYTTTKNNNSRSIFTNSSACPINKNFLSKSKLNKVKETTASSSNRSWTYFNNSSSNFKAKEYITNEFKSKQVQQQLLPLRKKPRE